MPCAYRKQGLELVHEHEHKLEVRMSITKREGLDMFKLALVIA